MTNEEKSAALEAFLRGELSTAEAGPFRRILQGDPALRAELALHQEIEEALGASPLNEWRSTVTSILEENRPTAPKRRPLVYWLLAALLALGLAAWLLLRSVGHESKEQLFAAYFQPPTALDQPGQQRTGGFARPDGNQLADSLYRAKNYRAALQVLEAQARNPAFEPSSAFYYQLGLLYLANREAGPALLNLNRIEVGYVYEKQWYHALAMLLSVGADVRTKAELQAIAYSDSPFRQDAAALLKRLE